MNQKAESKFNKLRAQAKSKISALTKEMEELKEGKGEVGVAGGPSPNTSLNISVRVGGMEWVWSVLDRRGVIFGINLRVITLVCHNQLSLVDNDAC